MTPFGGFYEGSPALRGKPWRRAQICEARVQTILHATGIPDPADRMVSGFRYGTG